MDPHSLNPPTRILIVDDERLARERLRGLLHERSDVTVVGESTNGLEALDAIFRLRPELVFLDVQMPDLDGLGVVEALDGVSRSGRREEIIFVTAHSLYMERAFETHAVDYLRKPYTNPRFYSALEQGQRRVLAGRLTRTDHASVGHAVLLKELRHGAVDSRIVVQDHRTGTWNILAAEDIDWVEADGSNVRLHQGKLSHQWRKTLHEVERLLEDRGFLRVHRSFIVNASRIRSVKALQKGEFALLLEGGAVIDTGRTYRDIVARFLQQP